MRLEKYTDALTHRTYDLAPTLLIEPVLLHHTGTATVSPPLSWE